MNTRHRQRNRKSCDDARAAWRAQLAAAARDPGLRAQLAQRERELFPRFAQQYRRLIALPRRARRALQRKWRRSLAAMALLLALGQGPALAATITVDGAAGCTLADAITAANTDTATGDLTLRQTTIRGGNVTLSGDTLCRRSTAFGEGGGVRNFGTLTVLNSTISGNAAVEGGGVFNCGGRVTITGSTVSGNAANGASGPFGATGTGGGVSSLGGTLIIADSTVSGNSAGNGGGIASNPSAGETTLIRNSSISGNTASQAGGSVFIGDGLAEIEHGTITGNTAPPPTNFSVGGGVAVVSDVRTEVRASIISGNASTDVDVVYGTTNSFVSGNFNVIGDGNATAAFNASGDVTGVADPSLGPLADNPPGDTRTHALLTGSPAIDRVNDGTCPPPDEDQRGVGRPQDGNGDGGPACDSGAYELQSAEPMCDGKVATIVGTGGNDVLRGTNRADVIVGLSGNDVIAGRNGDDTICGGNGGDVLRGGNGIDSLFGDADNDTLAGDNGDDALDGGDGTDALAGSRGSDALDGGADRDACSGGRGADSAANCEAVESVP